MRVGVGVRVRVSSHTLPEAHSTDDDERQTYDTLSPLSNQVHIERKLISQEDEDTAKQNLTCVMSKSPESAHERILRPAWSDGKRRQRRQVVRSGQRVQATSQKTSPRGFERHAHAYPVRDVHGAEPNGDRLGAQRVRCSQAAKHCESREYERRTLLERLTAECNEQTNRIQRHHDGCTFMQDNCQPKRKRSDECWNC